jgi:hypothetical protein
MSWESHDALIVGGLDSAKFVQNFKLNVVDEPLTKALLDP